MDPIYRHAASLIQHSRHAAHRLTAQKISNWIIFVPTHDAIQRMKKN
jgi:hypothetical protein